MKWLAYHEMKSSEIQDTQKPQEKGQSYNALRIGTEYKSNNRNYAGVPKWSNWIREILGVPISHQYRTNIAMSGDEKGGCPKFERKKILWVSPIRGSWIKERAWG